MIDQDYRAPVDPLLRPQGDCAKCGARNAFLDCHYVAPEPFVNARGDHMVDPEQLAWRCRGCGYEVTTPTLDAA